MRALASLTSGLALSWLAVRLVDIIVRGQIGTAFAFNSYALTFWTEVVSIGAAGVLLRRQEILDRPDRLFVTALVMAGGGMVYRYAPPLLAFAPQPMSWYTPTVSEILVSVAFIAWCHAGFLVAVKRLPILPAPMSDWDDLVDYIRYLAPWIQMTRSRHATSEHRSGYAY
jgi:Ni/Fe-hydrogenase subunit HybB-like protein